MILLLPTDFLWGFRHLQVGWAITSEITHPLVLCLGRDGKKAGLLWDVRIAGLLSPCSLRAFPSPDNLSMLPLTWPFQQGGRTSYVAA